jgi:hypothetical protein
LRAHEKEIQAAGARIAAIGLGDREYARKFREESGIDFPLLIDEERRAYRAARLKVATPLDLFKPSNLKARGRAREGGHRQHKLGKNPMQLGGSFVFGPGNVDRFSHWSSTFGDNAPVEKLIQVLTSRAA